MKRYEIRDTVQMQAEEVLERRSKEGKRVIKATRYLSRDPTRLQMTASEGEFGGQGGQRGAKTAQALRFSVFESVMWLL